MTKESRLGNFFLSFSPLFQFPAGIRLGIYFQGKKERKTEKRWESYQISTVIIQALFASLCFHQLLLECVLCFCDLLGD